MIPSFHLFVIVIFFFAIWLDINHMCNIRSDFKRDGAGRGNWGTPTDDIAS